MGIDKLSLEYILKHGSQTQIDALKAFGESAYNEKIDKLSKKYDASKFEGDFESFCKTELGEILNGKELKEVFKIIDANGDGKISAEEAADLAKAGNDKNDGEIDNSDIKALYQAGKEYATQDTPIETGTPGKTTETHEDGSKTVTVIKEDGTKIVSDYDKNGKKIKSVTTKTNGEETTQNYKYENGKLAEYTTVKKNKNGKTISSSKTTVDWKSDGSKTVTTVSDDGKKTVSEYNKDGKITAKTTTDDEGTTNSTKYEYKDGKLASTETIQTKVIDGQTVEAKTTSTSYVDGKKNETIVKDGNGNVIKTTEYTYTADGKLKESKSIKSNGEAVITEYNPNTGYKKTSTTVNTKTNRILSKTIYDEKNGKKISNKSYDYNSDGSVKYIRSYTYDSNGTLKTRDLFDAKGNIIRKSSYYHNEDGSMLRTDRDPNTGKVTGTKLFKYNSDGTTASKEQKDADGKTISYQEFSYYPSGVMKTNVLKKINEDGSYTIRTITYDELGNLKDTKVEKLDKDEILIPNNNQPEQTNQDNARTVFNDRLRRLITQFSEIENPTTQNRNQFEAQLNSILQNYTATEGLSESEIAKAKTEVEKLRLKTEMNDFKDQIKNLKLSFSFVKEPTTEQKYQYEAQLASLEASYNKLEQRYRLLGEERADNEAINALNQNFKLELDNFVAQGTLIENMTTQQRNQVSKILQEMYNEYKNKVAELGEAEEVYDNLQLAKAQVEKTNYVIEMNSLNEQITALKSSFDKIENATEQQINQYLEQLKDLEIRYNELKAAIEMQ